MGTENFENENACKFLSKEFVFFQNQWTFAWGLKISKMKIPEHFCQKSLCFFENQWTFEWGLKTRVI